ncbi:2-hydroxy-3-oxopropionate reductase [uncultured Draconibacterium sp.]|uniref:2-hydroxy-3-oxopropionate reductase n=1 Tax=uncultured Draconibacterium sp. TaxID=1573823 RepID=UPI0029C88897|nr:2-hydroxy-3-oxopropionate reductase [uncultured Draconibacterium sp.]
MYNTKTKIGFIGLGVMGKPMSLNLIKAGYSLMVFDINQDSVNEVVSRGAEQGNSPCHIGESCEIIITMLPNSPQVETVIAGANGVLEGAKPGSVIIDMSSISPITATKISAIAAEKGVEMIDAPVSGGEPKAIDGTLSIMAGGKEEVFESVKEILLSMGASAILIGEIGSGNICKLANQIMVALHLAAMSEAMVFAEKAGVDAEKVFQAIRGGLAGSTVLDAKIPLILDRNFKPGGPIRMHTKDLLNVRDTALEIDAPIPLTTQVMEFMKALKADGKQEDDHGGIIQYWEKLAHVEVKKK